MVEIDRGPQGAIDALRTGTLHIRTAPGATVTVTQQAHEFWFGTAITNWAAGEGGDSEARRRYWELLAANFNSAVHENALKWYCTEREPGQVDYGPADRILERCEALGIPMRGHCLFWEKQEFIQKWVQALDDAALLAAMERRCREVVRRYRGRIDEFDLNNEMVEGHYFVDRFGPGIVGDICRWAREENPAVRLYVNDYWILTHELLERYERQIEGLLEAAVPLAGIGCQGHFLDGRRPDPGRMVEALDRLGRFGLPIRITEYDCDTRRPDDRAEALRTAYETCFAHPSVEGILMWGFWEGAHWKPAAAPWAKDFAPTPVAEAYRELVFGQWWTRWQGTADAQGRCTVRAYFGRHRVEADHRSTTVTLARQAGSAELSL